MAGDIERIAVVGLGYVGLPTAAFFADAGFRVFGIDVDPEKVGRINEGTTTLTEPGFTELLKQVVLSGVLRAYTSVRPADCFIVAVPTPTDEKNGLDFSYIDAAAEQIASVISGGELVVLESTVAPGTTERLARSIETHLRELNGEGEGVPAFDVAHCPERVLPGRLMEEMSMNARVVGGLSDRATERATDLYSKAMIGSVYATDARTAEMVKLAENTYRDINIAFANELSMICDRIGVDVWELVKITNQHPRVNILEPGPGVGGHCIAVDPWFIHQAAPDLARLIRTAREVNDTKPHWLAEKVLREAQEQPEGPILFLGATYKADIDDVRNSPAVAVVTRVAEHLPNRQIIVVDPNLQDVPEELSHLGNVDFDRSGNSLDEAAVVVILVNHKQFREISFEELEGKPLVDARGKLGRE